MRNCELCKTTKLYCNCEMTLEMGTEALLGLKSFRNRIHPPDWVDVKLVDEIETLTEKPWTRPYRIITLRARSPGKEYTYAVSWDMFESFSKKSGIGILDVVTNFINDQLRRM